MYNSLTSKIYLAQQQVYNVFVYQKLVSFRTCISIGYYLIRVSPSCTKKTGRHTIIF